MSVCKVSERDFDVRHIFLQDACIQVKISVLHLKGLQALILAWGLFWVFVYYKTLLFAGALIYLAFYSLNRNVELRS